MQQQEWHVQHNSKDFYFKPDQLKLMQIFILNISCQICKLYEY
jgi:hypothetical protein